MGVRIGEVGVAVTIDWQNAKADVQKMKDSINRQEAKRKDVLKKIVSEERESTMTGKASKTLFEKFVEKKSQQVARGNEVSGRLINAIQAGSTLGNIGTVGKIAGAAAATYAISSELSKSGPTIMEFVKEFLPDAIAKSSLMQELENLRAAFTKLESNVIASFQAFGETKDLASASLRLTGQLPDLTYYYNQNREVDSQERQLRKKFERETNDQVAGALGGILKKSLSDAMR